MILHIEGNNGKLSRGYEYLKRNNTYIIAEP